MSSPWQSSGPDPLIRRLAERPAPVVTRRPSPLRDPPRALIVVGGLLAIVASPLPWLTRIGNPPAETRTGWSGTADGFLLAVVAIVLIALALSRGAGSSRSRGLRLMPAGLGALAAVLGFGSLRALENQVDLWERGGATGVYEPWVFVAVAGAGIVAAGGVWLGIRQSLQPMGPRDPTDTFRITRAGVASVALGGLGVLVGSVGAALVVLNSGLNDVAMSMPLLFGILIGSLFGGYVGDRVARIVFAQPSAVGLERDPDMTLERVGSATVVGPGDRRDQPPRPDA